MLASVHRGVTLRCRLPTFLVLLLGIAPGLAAEGTVVTLFPRAYPPGLLSGHAGNEPALLSLSWSSEDLLAGDKAEFTLPRSSLRIPEFVSPIAATFPEGSVESSPTRRHTFDTKTNLVAGGILLSVASISYLKWWNGPSTGFHFRTEGFFGRQTYAGGMDKASHFVFAYAIFEPVESLYRLLDHPSAESRALAFGTGVGMGAVVEAGDGFGTGASWEDLLADTLGCLAAFSLRTTGLDDTVGFRYGWVPTGNWGTYRHGAFTSDYSQEIYSADLKLGGLFRRLRLSPQIARFLLLSMTYDTRGYGNETVPLEARERNLGVALGINIAEVVRALGLPEDRWWSKPLYGFLTYVRFPYTAFGVRYDMNHHRWQGPDTGDRYHPAASP